MTLFLQCYSYFLTEHWVRTYDDKTRKKFLSHNSPPKHSAEGQGNLWVQIAFSANYWHLPVVTTESILHHLSFTIRSEGQVFFCFVFFKWFWFLMPQCILLMMILHCTIQDTQAEYFMHYKSHTTNWYTHFKNTIYMFTKDATNK